jgi:hypothetical protein
MGFNQELKDFIGAWQAGDKIAGSADDHEYKKLRNRVLKANADKLSDPDYVALEKKRLDAQVNYYNGRANRGRDPELTRSRALSNQLRELQIDQLKNPPQAPSAADSVPGYTAPPSSGKRSALDVDGSFDTAQDDTGGAAQPWVNPDTGEEQDTSMAARGGMIARRGYASGGAVEEDTPDDSEETSAPADESDITPEAADTQERQDDAEDEQDDAGGALDTSEPSVAPAPSGKTVAYSPQAAHDAVVGGLKYAAKVTGHGKTPEDGGDGSALPVNARTTAARGLGSRSYLSGAGAASHDDMTKVMKAVDPENKMSDSERTMAALATTYEWNLKRNDPAAADKTAASMMQYFRVASDRYKAMMQVAASHGDVDGTMKMAMKSYGNIPDGKDLKLEKTADGKGIQYSFTDDSTGKVITQGIAPPEQILEFATKGSMHTFDDVLSASAAGRAQQATTAKASAAEEKAAALAAKGLKINDMDKVEAGVKGAIDELPADSIAKEDIPEIKGAAVQMKAANTGMAYGDALLATVEMTRPDAKLAGTAVDGGVKVKLKNGATMFVPDELVGRLKNARDLNTAAAAKKATAAKASSDRIGSTMSALGAMIPSAPKPAPYTPRGPDVPFSVGPSVPLDEAPAGWVPNRGLGER